MDGSWTVLVFDGDTGGRLAARASLEATEANDLDAKDGLRKGRAAPNRRDEERRAAMAIDQECGVANFNAVVQCPN